MMIKKTPWNVLAFLFLTLSFNYQLYAAPKVIEKVSVVVNNKVILESEINNMMSSIKASTDPNNLPEDKILRQQVIDRLIIESLIQQEAEKLNITVSDQDVSLAINNIAKENNMTLDQLKSYLSSMGIKYKNYQERIANDILLDQTRMNAVRQRITISDKEVENLANTIAKQPTNNREVKISHMLIPIVENPTTKQLSDATNQVKNIMKRLNNGENFAKLATSFSKDEYALKGGEMGWFNLNDLPSLFEESLVKAQKGDIVGPIRSNAGYHIIKVDDNRSEKQQVVKVKEVNARHILIKTNVLIDDNTAKNKLNEIRQSILNKTTTFASAAKAYSEDPGSTDNGGELGWSNPDRYDNAFKNALLKLKKGEISKPIKSAFGWHLIQLISTRSVDRTNMATKDQAYRAIFNRKFAEESQVWLQELKGDAYIKIVDQDNE